MAKSVGRLSLSYRTNLVTLSQWLHLSKPQFSHLYNGIINCIYLLELNKILICIMYNLMCSPAVNTIAAIFVWVLSKPSVNQQICITYI